MKVSSAAATVAALLLHTASGATRTFVDDAGVTHTTSNDKPTFFTRGRQAIAFHHMGFGTDQIKATYGLWFVRGSKIDLDNHQSDPFFATDSSPTDVDFLRSVSTNLSPHCYNIPSGCTTMNMDIFEAMNPKPEFWVYVDNGSSNGFFTSYVQNITTIMGKPPIFIDTRYENNPGCRHGPNWDYQPDISNGNDATDNCIFRSLIDVIQRTEELAEFLGHVPDQAQLAKDKEDLCKAAVSFSDAAADAHKRGVRAMFGAVFEVQNQPSVIPFSIRGDAFQQTLAELGMPFLHPGICLGKPCGEGPYPGYEMISSVDWFPQCTEADKDNLKSCNSESLYPIDLWITEGRAYPSLTDTVYLENKLPEPTLLEGQLVHIPNNDGAISYRNAANHLNYLADTLYNTKRIHPATTCTPANITSEDHLKADSGGLGPGEYACYDRATHQHAYFLGGCSGSYTAESANSAAATTTIHQAAGLWTVVMVAVGTFLL